MTVLLLGKRFGLTGLPLGWWAELRSNRRGAIGLLAIVLLIAGYGFVALRDGTERVRERYDQEATQLQRIAEVANERDWPQRAAASQALRQTLEAQLWRAESEGVARADIQDWIGNGGRQIGLPSLDVRIETAHPKPLPPDLLQVSATITAQPSEAALIALLGYIARAPHRVVVERFNVKQQPGPYLEMVLIGYAKIGGPETPK